jgi:hypothetical protein
MLTSYLVKCPHLECGWFGSLLPLRDVEAWRGPIPTVPIAVFQCPRCDKQWRARVVGDDVKALPVEETAPVS